TPSGDVTLEPHETKAFTLKLALISRAASSGTWDDEPFGAHLAAVYSTEGQTGGAAEWQLKATVAPTIRVTPPVLRVGTRSERQIIEESVRIEAGPGIVSLEVDGSPDWSV